ncbi:MAG: SprT-like domain-containing protein [Muribaculaceae bacterium]|nr:SprT-like domain-containing protein [Muribaculaceae bacterium]
MRPTVDYIERKFDEFNSLCFGSRLPKPLFRVTNARSYLGKMVCRSGADGSRTFELLVSRAVDRSENVVEDTVLHEMIHYYILYNRIPDRSAHGPAFRSMMDGINRRFGRGITISYKAGEAEQSADRDKRRHLLCAVRLADGRTGVIVSAGTRLLQLWDAVMQERSISVGVWLLSYNPFFNRFPRSRVLKMYRLAPEELSKELAGARRLERQGCSVRVGAEISDAVFPD